jgi:hypothetical protein
MIPLLTGVIGAAIVAALGAGFWLSVLVGVIVVACNGVVITPRR